MLKKYSCILIILIVLGNSQHVFGQTTSFQVGIIGDVCLDGIDNDLDGFIDFPDDTDCLDPTGDSEGIIVAPPDEEVRNASGRRSEIAKGILDIEKTLGATYTIEQLQELISALEDLQQLLIRQQTIQDDLSEERTVVTVIENQGQSQVEVEVRQNVLDFVEEVSVEEPEEKKEDPLGRTIITESGIDVLSIEIEPGLPPLEEIERARQELKKENWFMKRLSESFIGDVIFGVFVFFKNIINSL